MIRYIAGPFQHRIYRHRARIGLALSNAQAAVKGYRPGHLNLCFNSLWYAAKYFSRGSPTATATGAVRIGYCRDEAERSGTVSTCDQERRHRSCWMLIPESGRGGKGLSPALSSYELDLAACRWAAHSGGSPVHRICWEDLNLGNDVSAGVPAPSRRFGRGAVVESLPRLTDSLGGVHARSLG